MKRIMLEHTLEMILADTDAEDVHIYQILELLKDENIRLLRELKILIESKFTASSFVSIFELLDNEINKLRAVNDPIGKF